MKIGDIVRFRKGLYADEKDAVYEVMEINGDRAIIKYVCDLAIPPQSIAKLDELEVIPEGGLGPRPAE